MYNFFNRSRKGFSNFKDKRMSAKSLLDFPIYADYVNPNYYDDRDQGIPGGIGAGLAGDIYKLHILTPCLPTSNYQPLTSKSGGVSNPDYWNRGIYSDTGDGTGAITGFEASQYPENENLQDWHQHPRPQQELYYKPAMPPTIIGKAETYDPWANINNENTGRMGVPPVPTYPKEKLIPAIYGTISWKK